MAYIGKTPITGNFVKLDAISVVNGQAAYTMNNGGSAFTDYENVNQFLVSLNGILQAPTDSFTVSGSTLTFASNLATGDVIDFVIVLGNTLDIGTPSDATVTQAKTNFVSTSSAAGLQIKGDSTTAGTLQLNCEQNSHGVKLRSPAHSSGQSYTLTLPTGNVTADKFLKVASVSGSGTTGIGQLSFADAGGTQTLISSVTASSSAQIDITSGIDSTYKNYLIRITNMHPATDNTDFRCRFFTSAGIRTGADYQFSFQGRRSNGGDIQGNSNGATYISMSPQMAGNDAVENSNYEIILSNPASTTYYKSFRYWNNMFNTESLLVGGVGSGSWNSTTAVTGLRFYMDSGNIDDGQFDLIGLS